MQIVRTGVSAVVLSALLLTQRIVAQEAQVDVSGLWQGGHYTLSQHGDNVTSEGDFGHANGHFTGPYTFVMSWASATWTATVSTDGNKIDWNNNTHWTRSSSSGGGSVKTQRTGILTVRHAGGNCTSNVCGPGHCAGCLTLTVYLPLNAQVVVSRCYTTAGGPQGDSATPAQVQCGAELNAWAMFDATRQYTTPNNTVIETVFHNRSSDRDRQVELQVDWN
ncbi:MAG: hypothetical protein WB992_11285 [Bryobacteraceae bacterium]